MTLQACLVLAFLLFSIGIYGMLTRRNAIGILISMELMLNAANINFIAFAHFKALDATAGAVFSLFVIAVTACEMAIALAIAIIVYRRHGFLDVDKLTELRDPDV
ncbi:MAG: NADH-quinone oxidoreductase subunit NuoK [Fibromonadaceae bacterium]|jgi:NADH-quinone oxidoreductase subunit K|nr:NADH-quinone oxidoreductase subunit NuoK [Fibromonadaceae bacterium]